MLLAHRNGTIEAVELIEEDCKSITVISIEKPARRKKILRKEVDRKIFYGGSAAKNAVNWIKGNE